MSKRGGCVRRATVRIEFAVEKVLDYFGGELGWAIAWLAHGPNAEEFFACKCVLFLFR